MPSLPWRKSSDWNEEEPASLSDAQGSNNDFIRLGCEKSKYKKGIEWNQDTVLQQTWKDDDVKRMHYCDGEGPIDVFFLYRIILDQELLR
jgi:hypothetical protein